MDDIIALIEVDKYGKIKVQLVDVFGETRFYPRHYWAINKEDFYKVLEESSVGNAFRLPFITLGTILACFSDALGTTFIVEPAIKEDDDVCLIIQIAPKARFVWGKLERIEGELEDSLFYRLHGEHADSDGIIRFGDKIVIDEQNYIDGALQSIPDTYIVSNVPMRVRDMILYIRDHPDNPVL